MYYYYTTTTTTTTTLLLLLQYYTLLTTSCIVQCAKQPYGSVSCGFYVCEYLRTCSRYSSSCRQLKKAQSWCEKEKVDPRFRQTVAHICKFIIEAAHEGRTFFNKDGDLALDPKFERIRNWSDKEKGLQMKYYLLPSLDDM